MKLFHRFLKKTGRFSRDRHLKRFGESNLPPQKAIRATKRRKRKMHEKDPKLSCTCPQGFFRVFTNPNHIGNGWAGWPL